jgi:hypothetical protein
MKSSLIVNILQSFSFAREQKQIHIALAKEISCRLSIAWVAACASLGHQLMSDFGRVPWSVLTSLLGFQDGKRDKYWLNRARFGQEDVKDIL